MQPTRESSLLFSLAELQRMEDTRQVEERVHAEAKAAAESADALQKREAEALAQRMSEDRAAEMQELRKQVLDGKNENHERHVELLTLREFRRLSEMEALEPPLVSTVEFPQSISRTSHLWWAGTLVAACAGVYLLVGNTKTAELRVSTSPVPTHVAPPPEQAAQVALPCTQAAPAEEVAVAEPAEVPLKTLNKGKTRSGKGTNHRPRGGSHRPDDESRVIPKKCIGSKDPLCGLDDL